MTIPNYLILIIEKLNFEYLYPFYNHRPNALSIYKHFYILVQNAFASIKNTSNPSEYVLF